MTTKFEDIEATGTPFLSVSQNTISLLESITADEKGQTVPYIKIWQIDPNTGEPVHGKDGQPVGPINLQTSEPPRFGTTVDRRFRERPDVSLEDIGIKAEASYGIIQTQFITIKLTVHNPDALNGSGDREGADSWPGLLIPGSVHILEYGWSASPGVKNGILNGEGFGDTGKNPPVVVPGRKLFPFSVMSYDFAITPDDQIRLSIEGNQNGDFNLRQATLGAKRIREEFERARTSLAAARANAGWFVPSKEPVDIYNSVHKEVIDELKRRVKKLGEESKRNHRLGLKPVVNFRDFADEVLAPTIDEALREMGYGDIRLIFGRFNKRAGTPADKYGGTDLSDKSIGEFQIPLQYIENAFSTAVKDGEQITLMNFVQLFLNVFHDPAVWDRRNAKKNRQGQQNQTIPQVTLRLVTNPKKKSAVVYIFDVKHEFSRFTDDDRKKGNEGLTNEQVHRALFDKGIPVISFLKGNSYIKEANFNVQNDDQMKSIFIRRYIGPGRTQTVGSTNIAQKLDTAIDPRQLIYSSAIRGSVTMIGNFAFDMFGVVWLEFGVKAWDGTFRVIGFEDSIGKETFERKIELMSEGDDALGTQGRIVNKQVLESEQEERRLDQSRKNKQTPANRNNTPVH